MKEIIEQAWDNRELLAQQHVKETIRKVIAEIDRGTLRVAQPSTKEPTGWVVNEWIKKAVILYFPIQEMEVMEVGPFEFHDKNEIKNRLFHPRHTRNPTSSSQVWCIH